MIIWGHNYIQYKKLFFPCVLFVCVWCKDNCMSVAVCAPMEAREMPGVFSPWLSALLPLAWALTGPEACLCNLVCWQSTLGPCLPSSVGVTGMFSHTQLVTWALGFELRFSCFQSTRPHKAKIPSPKIPLVMKSTFICLSRILLKDVFFFMAEVTALFCNLHHLGG